MAPDSPIPPATAGHSQPTVRPEGCRAPLRGGGGRVGGPAGRRAVRPRRPRPGRAWSGSPLTFPQPSFGLRPECRSGVRGMLPRPEVNVKR